MIIVLINDNKLVSITEINRNFSKIARTTKESNEPVIIMKNNKPDLVLINYDVFKKLVSLYNKENTIKTANEIMDEYAEVFKELAKWYLSIRVWY